MVNGLSQSACDVMLSQRVEVEVEGNNSRGANVTKKKSLSKNTKKMQKFEGDGSCSKDKANSAKDVPMIHLSQNSAPPHLSTSLHPSQNSAPPHLSTSLHNLSSSHNLPFGYATFNQGGSMGPQYGGFSGYPHMPQVPIFPTYPNGQVYPYMPQRQLVSGQQNDNTGGILQELFQKSTKNGGCRTVAPILLKRRPKTNYVMLL
ncbi:hypothetical protein SESBI_18206 [Sesbania bispinosa]|nr:hypothetical protein SESBI_18206 [Sesbania bispinosa]